MAAASPRVYTFKTVTPYAQKMSKRKSATSIGLRHSAGAVGPWSSRGHLPPLSLTSPRKQIVPEKAQIVQRTQETRMVKTESSGRLHGTSKRRPFWATETTQGLTHEDFEAKLQAILETSALEMQVPADPKVPVMESRDSPEKRTNSVPAEIHFHASG